MLAVNSYEAMLQMPKPPPPKSHPFSNSEFVAFRKRPVLPRLVVSSRLGMSISTTNANTIHKWSILDGSKTNLMCNSDGIARVHGMNNVQAEELVE